MEKNIFLHWLSWHFYDMPKAILKAWRNFLWFNLNYFSLPILLKTLFSPWHRYRYSYTKPFSFKKYINIWFFNTMSRAIGFFLRILIIISGVLIEVFIFFAGIILFFCWLLLPIFLLLLLFFGVKLILF